MEGGRSDMDSPKSDVAYLQMCIMHVEHVEGAGAHCFFGFLCSQQVFYYDRDCSGSSSVC